tara:strand:+ start:1018 stop:1329 length:312 start_codon:yes stop_codon:yes gene_type:complete
MFARSKTKRATKQNLLSLTLSPVLCFPPFFDDRDKTAETEYMCVLSLGVFPLLFVLLKRAQSASFFSLWCCCVAGQKLGFDPKSLGLRVSGFLHHFYHNTRRI